MTSAFRLLPVLCLALWVPLPAAAEEVTVTQGGVSIQVPVPEGFTSIGKDEEEFKQLSGNQEAAGNELLAVFLATPRTHTPQDFMKIYMVGLDRGMADKFVTKAYVKAAAKGINERKKDYKDAQKAVGMPGLVMESTGDSSDRHESWISYDSAEESAGRSNVTLAVLRGRLWSLTTIAVGQEIRENVGWVTTASKSWVPSVIAANPSDADTLAKENEELTADERAKRIGSVVGVLLVAIVWIVIQKRKNKAKAAA